MKGEDLSRAFLNIKYTVQEEHKDLIKNMLKFNPKDRFTIQQIVEHASLSKKEDQQYQKLLYSNNKDAEIDFPSQIQFYKNDHKNIIDQKKF
jgi:serine/threonine protein kinase